MKKSVAITLLSVCFLVFSGCGGDGDGGGSGGGSDLANQLCGPYICEYISQCGYDNSGCLGECNSASDSEIQAVANCLNSLNQSCAESDLDYCLP